MVEAIRNFLFKKTAADFHRKWAALAGHERRIEGEVNRRVAETLMQMDTFEPLMREFNGVFTSDRERPEDGLDAKSLLQLRTWANMMDGDPSFIYLMDWMINEQGNKAVKLGNPTPRTILFSRAMIAAPLVLKKEVHRLSESYKDMLAERDAAFDPHLTVDDE